MKLSKANPHLRQAEKARKSLWISAKSSSAIEGIYKPFERDNATRQPASMEALADYWTKLKRTKSAR